MKDWQGNLIGVACFICAIPVLVLVVTFICYVLCAPFSFLIYGNLGDACAARPKLGRKRQTSACRFSTTRRSWEAMSCVPWRSLIILSIAVL